MFKKVLLLSLIAGFLTILGLGRDLPGSASELTSQWRVAFSGVRDLIFGGAIRTLKNPDSHQLMDQYLLRPRLILTEKKTGSSTCRCGPWGDCPASVCSCEDLCPNHYQVLDRPDAGRFRSPQQSLSILNTDTDFKGIGYQREFGYCWGHVSLTRNLNWAAYFRPTQSTDSIPTDRFERRRYYERKFEQVAQGIFTEIPGFANAFEFSSAFPELVGRTQARLWKSYAIHPRSVASFFSPYQQMNALEIQNELEKITLRVSKGMQPKLYIGASGRLSDVHIVRTLSVETGLDLQFLDSRGVKHAVLSKICVEDPNLDFQKNDQCQNYIALLKDGQIYYSKYEREQQYSGKIGGFGITYEDDDDQLLLIQASRQYCQKLKGCQ